MGQQTAMHAHEWEAIFDSINSAIWILDDQYRIKRANKATEKFFGLPVIEAVGKHCWEIAHEDSLPIPDCPLTRAIKSKKRESIEIQAGERWLEITVDTIPAEKEGAGGYIHIISDISSRKLSQILLSKSEEKHRIVSDYAYDWEYWIGRDGEFLYNSPSCERITGYSPSEFLSESELLIKIIFPEDKSKFTEHLKVHKLADPSPFSLEFRVISKNGTIKWLEHICQPVYAQNGEFVGRRACNRDISDRKQIESDLITSEKQLRAILEASAESVFLMDKAGNCLMANTTTAERLNIDVDTLQRRNMFDFIPSEVAETRKEYLKQVAETGNPIRFEDERFGRSFLHSIYPIKDAEGRVEHFAIFGFDITEEKKSQQTIEESRRKLSEINSMLHTVINTIPVRIFWKNLNSIYLGCNNHFAQDAGKSEPNEIIGKNDYSMPWKEEAESYIQDDQSVMIKGEPKINYEETQTAPDGHRIWLRTTKIPLRNQDGDVVGVLGTYEDITQEKEIADMLRESEERYRNFFQNNHTTQLIIDPENGSIVDANSSACLFYGYEHTSFVGKSVTDLHVLPADQVYEKLALAKSQQRSHFSFSHRLANGEIRPVEVYSGPIAINSKKFLFSIVNDISDRKKADEERERLISELQNALLKIKKLSGLLPICCSCKNIRDDQGYWNQIEGYIRDHAEVEFTHSICPDCAKKLYPDIDLK